MLSQVERTMMDRNPRLPFQEVPEGLEYRVAAPLYGPYYWQWPWGSPHLAPESYYLPREGFPQPQPFIPRWSGAFIQPGNLDPGAYDLVYGSGQLGGLKAPQTGIVAGMVLAVVARKMLQTSLLAAVSAGLLAAVLYSGAEKTSMGQVGPMHVEDPTGGAFYDIDPIYGYGLGPGESIAVGSQWVAQLKPRGFSAAG